MIKVEDSEFKVINELYASGDVIKSLKKQCNLINNNVCEADILLDFRKKIYSTFISGDSGIDDDVIKMFKIAIEKCTLNNQKYNIPFIKKAIYYLEQKNNVDYDEINWWLDCYNVDLLNDSVFGNNKFSDRELYYLKRAKSYDETKKLDLLKQLMPQYENEKKQNEEIVFFIKFHICKLLFNCKDFEKANNYLDEILVKKREKYVLGLPIKYHDYSDEKKVIMYILEILLDGCTPDYLCAYIINWLKSSSYAVLVDNVSDCFQFVGNNYIINDFEIFKRRLICDICNLKDICNNIKDGIIINITKTGNGFVQIDNSSYFVEKRYVGKHFKRGFKIKCFLIDKYNREKNQIMKEVIIINRRYLNEVLCSKKGK